MGLGRAVASISSWTLLSRILGFVRDMLMAAALGTSLIADAFLVAFKFPNLFRRLIAEGAFNAAFVPMFAQRIQGNTITEAKAFASEVISVMLVVLFVLTGICLVLMPYIINVIAPGFARDSEEYALAVTLTRITFPYLACITLVSLLGGMLNALGGYWYGAVAPVLLNIVMIAAILFLTAHTPTAGHALAWGVLVAGIVQLAWICYGIYRNDLVVPLQKPTLTPAVKKLLKLMAPGILGAGVFQLNVMIDMILASLLAEGSISYLYYADRVNQLPLSMVGVALGTALLPMLARVLREGQVQQAMRLQVQALEIGLFFTIPAAIGLIVLAEPVIITLFERGAFTAVSSGATIPVLQIFAMGLPAYVGIKVCTTCFFARLDTKTPVYIAIAAVSLNLLLNLALMPIFQHVGIAMATSIAAWVNVAVMAYILWKRGLLEVPRSFVIFTGKTMLACCIMAAVVIALMQSLWQEQGSINTVGKGGSLILLITSGCISFFLAVYALKIITISQFKSAMRRK